MTSSSSNAVEPETFYDGEVRLPGLPGEALCFLFGHMVGREDLHEGVEEPIRRVHSFPERESDAAKMATG